MSVTAHVTADGGAESVQWGKSCEWEDGCHYGTEVRDPCIGDWIRRVPVKSPNGVN